MRITSVTVSVRVIVNYDGLMVRLSSAHNHLLRTCMLHSCNLSPAVIRHAAYPSSLSHGSFPNYNNTSRNNEAEQGVNHRQGECLAGSGQEE